MLFLIIAMLSDINSPTFLFYFTKRWFHFVDNVILLLILHTDVAIIIVQKTNDFLAIDLLFLDIISKTIS